MSDTKKMIDRLAAFVADRDYDGIRDAVGVLIGTDASYRGAKIAGQTLEDWNRWPKASPTPEDWDRLLADWKADRDCPGMVGEWTLQGTAAWLRRDGDDEEYRGAAVLVTSPGGGCWTGTVCPTWGDDPENTDDWVTLTDEHGRQHGPPVQLIEPLEHLGRECPEQGPMTIVWEISSDGEGRRVGAT
mgnify:CR=1 FL=1